MQLDETRDSKPEQRGKVIMPLLSLINHSCNPNIFRLPRATHVVLYAKYPIQKGEQVLSWLYRIVDYGICQSLSFILLQLLDSYGPYFASTSREARQKKLLNDYYFKCDCVPCQENWPLYDELESFEVNN